MGNYDFDLDLPEGEAAERLINEILTGERGTIEVKRDYKVSDTGNIAIEYRCRGKLSGISITKATWWAFVLDGNKYGHELVILIKTKRLKEMARDLYNKGFRVIGGDDKKSEMVLISLKTLVNWHNSIMQAELI